MHPWIQYSYSNAHNWTRKYISINKIRDYKGDNLGQHVYKQEKPSPPPGPPPPQLSISQLQAHKEKGIFGRILSAPKGQRDADSSIRKTEETMEYSFLTLQFLLLQCI